MDNHNISRKIKYLILSYLSDRQVIVDKGINIDSKIREPQGSNASPVLWHLIINDQLMNILNDAGYIINCICRYFYSYSNMCIFPFS